MNTELNTELNTDVETNTEVEVNPVVAHLLALPTKSARIRFLFEQGMSRGAIAKVLGIRYQHVRNVLITPVKTPRSV